MREDDEILKRAEEAADARLAQLNEALSEAAHRLGAVTMKLAIGKALREAGYYDETVVALAVPIPDLAATVEMYTLVIGEIKNPSTETKQ